MLSEAQNAIHSRAKELSQKYHRIEWELIQILQEVEQSRLFKALGIRSLFEYCVSELNLSESVAYAFITVSRKSRSIADLSLAISTQRLSVSKASRIVSAITPENASELVKFAEKNSLREIDFEVARRKPKAISQSRVKPLSNEYVEIRLTVPIRVLEKLKRAEALEAQRKKRHVELPDAFEYGLDEYLKRHDPVLKAKRALEKAESSATLSNRVSEGGRTKLSAKQKHQVFARDGGRCTHIDAGGNRCNCDRWIEIHHIRPVSLGGTNDPDNLTTLCSFHHDLVHQLSLEIDGQVTWLRSPRVEYAKC